MKYACTICGYIYDDAKEKIPFSQLPDSWKCPICGAGKSAFAPMEEKKPADVSDGKRSGVTLKKLNAGQLAAVCTNLARGCEKQYMSDAAELYRKLGDYFTEAAVPSADETVDKLLSQLESNVSEDYPCIKVVAQQSGDRGAQRAMVWGEKVTRMLSFLMEKYSSGKEMLADNESVWVCTACGFVYIGTEPPPRCPVCKVPAHKFEKIEGGESA